MFIFCEYGAVGLFVHNMCITGVWQFQYNAQFAKLSFRLFIFPLRSVFRSQLAPNVIISQENHPSETGLHEATTAERCHSSSILSQQLQYGLVRIITLQYMPQRPGGHPLSDNTNLSFYDPYGCNSSPLPWDEVSNQIHQLHQPNPSSWTKAAPCMQNVLKHKHIEHNGPNMRYFQHWILPMNYNLPSKWTKSTYEHATMP